MSVVVTVTTVTKSFYLDCPDRECAEQVLRKIADAIALALRWGDGNVITVSKRYAWRKDPAFGPVPEPVGAKIVLNPLQIVSVETGVLP